MSKHADKPIQYGPPPLRPGLRWETKQEERERIALLNGQR